MQKKLKTAFKLKQAVHELIRSLRPYPPKNPKTGLKVKGEAPLKIPSGALDASVSRRLVGTLLHVGKMASRRASMVWN